MQSKNVVMKEKEISLVNLCVEIMLHWRVIVVTMLVGGIILGGFSYIQSVKLAAIQQAELDEAEEKLASQKEQSEADEVEMLNEADRQWLEERLSETEIANVNTAVLYEKLYKEKENYMKDSVLMQIDPFNVPRAELTFIIQSDDIEKAYSIEKVYEDILTSTALLSYVREECEIEGAVNELINLERTSYGEIQGLDTLRIKMVHSDEDVCQAMSNAIVDYVNQQQKELKNILGSHEVNLVAQSIGTIVDNDLLTLQKNCRVDINSWKSTVANLRVTFSEEQWNLYNFLTSGKATGNPDEVEDGEDTETKDGESVIALPTVTTPSVSIKYVVLGMILFAFAYVFVIFLMYMLNNKISATDNLQDMYNIPQLGTIFKGQEEKKFLGIIDQWIMKLRNRNQRRFTEEEAVNLTTVATKMAVKKQDINKVCLLGCNITGEALGVCEQVKERLTAEGISVKILSNVLYDAEKMELLADMQGAVLVETVGSTLYDEIVRELELLNRQNIAVLGGIIVE